MKVRNILQFFFLSILLFTGCFNKKEIKDYKKFASIYVDFLIAEEKNKGNFDQLIKEKNQIFERYGITSEQYKNTLLYYNQNQEKWGEFFSEVNKRILELKKSRGRKPS